MGIAAPVLSYAPMSHAVPNGRVAPALSELKPTRENRLTPLSIAGEPVGGRNDGDVIKEELVAPCA